jgi:glutaredoxin-related protein
MAQTISDSLKATWRNEVVKVFLKGTKLNPKFIIDNIDELGILYKRINIFTRWLIKRKVNRYQDYLVDWKYLLNVLDERTFTEAFLFVSELEGNKKKVVVENQSVETLQKEK